MKAAVSEMDAPEGRMEGRGEEEASRDRMETGYSIKTHNFRSLICWLGA